MSQIASQNPGEQIHLSDEIRKKVGHNYGRYWMGMGWCYPFLEQKIPQLKDFNYTIDYERGIITLGEKKR